MDRCIIGFWLAFCKFVCYILNMKERSRGEELHALAIQAREKEQDFLKALQLCDEALLLSAQDNDHENIAGIQGSRRNTYGHLYNQTGNQDYLVLAKYAALAAVELAEKHRFDEMALPYKDLANAFEELKDYLGATENYKKALGFESSPSLSRPAVKDDLLAHLGFAEYMSGDKENGLDHMDEAIVALEADTAANKYEHDVWLSGALMRKAFALKDKESLEKAREIIDANPELVLRKQQFEKLASEFK